MTQEGEETQGYHKTKCDKGPLLGAPNLLLANHSAQILVLEIGRAGA